MKLILAQILRQAFIVNILSFIHGKLAHGMASDCFLDLKNNFDLALHVGELNGIWQEVEHNLLVSIAVAKYLFKVFIFTDAHSQSQGHFFGIC